MTPQTFSHTLCRQYAIEIAAKKGRPLMRFVVAPDSFKGSLSSREAGTIIRSAILAERPNAIVDVVPMADGGEGSVDAFLSATGGSLIAHQATGPLGETLTTAYGILGDRETAIIEVAATAGLTLVPADRRNPLRTTTTGVGHSIRHALDGGLRKFILAMGGSATNDGGMGMLQALGVRFLDEHGHSVSPCGLSLDVVRTVDYTTLDPRLLESVLRGACDVDNPLCGPRGAAFTYAAQKGATPAQIRQLDAAMGRYADRVESHLKQSFREIKGAGAAGGVGFALLTLGAKLLPGARLIGEAAGLERLMTDADWLITGEGKTDSQTLNGKVPFYLASVAARHKVPVILISGCIADDSEELRRHFQRMLSLVDRSTPADKAMAEAKRLLYERTRHAVRLQQP